MRKILFALLALVSMSASAQYEYWIGGTADLGIGNTPGAEHSESEKVLMAGPSVGFVYSDVLEFGASAGFYHDRNLENNFGVKFTEIKAAPFVRYTIWENGDGWEKGDLSFFAQGQVGIDKITSPVDVYSTGNRFKTYERDLFTWGVGILPGIKYQITERFALVGTFGMIGYMNHSYKTNMPISIQETRNGGMDITLSELGFDTTVPTDGTISLMHTAEALTREGSDLLNGKYTKQSCSEFVFGFTSGLSISLNYCF